MIAKLHRLLVSGHISAQELALHYLEKIEQENPRLNAFITVTKEEALRAARAVDQNIADGKAVPLLAGIPFSLKDNLSTRGIRTSCASRMLADYYPVFDATVWALLRQQGAVLLGKNNMDEFAMGTTGETSFFGPARNPLDLRRSPGGSSSGGAAAVAGGLAVCALGTDTGGSVRQPAACCGLVGLKPTYGALSRSGLIAYASSLDTVGLLTTGVEDAAILFDALAQPDRQDATSLLRSAQSICASLPREIAGLRIGLPELAGSLSDDVRHAVRYAADTFERLGARLVFLPHQSFDIDLSTYYTIALSEAASNLARYDGIRFGHRAKACESLETLLCRSRAEGFGPEVRRRILLGNYLLSSECSHSYYQKALQLRQNIKKSFSSLFEIVDVILGPVCENTPPLLAPTETAPVSSCLIDRFTVSASLAGLPALSLPCIRDVNRFPLSIQLTGNHCSEALLLRVGYALETQTKIAPAEDNR